MNVSKRSWHYRFYDWASDFRPPENLCPYVRGLLLRLALTGVVACFMGFVAFCVFVVPVFSALFWIISGIAPEGIWLVLPLIVVAVGVFWSIMFGIKWLNAYLGQMHILPKVDWEDNIAYQYCKAVHDKVCPKIDFTE